MNFINDALSDQDGMLMCAVLELMGRLLGVSPLGDYDSPLQLLIYMTAIKPIARMFIKLPKWAPRLENGRAIQVCSCVHQHVIPWTFWA